MKPFIYRTASITSVLSAHIHRGISSTLGLVFNPKVCFLHSKTALLSRKKFHNNFHKCQVCLSNKRLWEEAVARCDAHDCLWLFYRVEKNLIHTKTSVVLRWVCVQNDPRLQLTLKMLNTWGEAEGLPKDWSLKDGPVMACSSVPLSSRRRPDTWQGFRKWKGCGPAEGVVP